MFFLFQSTVLWETPFAMPRERDPDEPRIYFLPNLMTAGNLACGFFAILMVFQGMIEVQKAIPEGIVGIKQGLSGKEYYEITRKYYEYAILLIFGSCLFDLLDGRLARLGGKESPFGQEFDSLADIVSFGLAPAMLLSKAVLFALPENVGWILGFIYLLCGAMRLARFNCLAVLPKKPGDKGEFRGIPIPMAAGFIASITFLIIDIYRTDRELGAWTYTLAAAMLGLSALMISDVRYPSFKKVDFRTRGTLWAIVIAAVLVVVTVKFRYVMPVVLFSVYLLYGLIRPFIAKRLKRELAYIEGEDDDDDDAPKPDQPAPTP